MTATVAPSASACSGGTNRSPTANRRPVRWRASAGWRATSASRRPATVGAPVNRRVSDSRPTASRAEAKKRTFTSTAKRLRRVPAGVGDAVVDEPVPEQAPVGALGDPPAPEERLERPAQRGEPVEGDLGEVVVLEVVVGPEEEPVPE